MPKTLPAEQPPTAEPFNPPELRLGNEVQARSRAKDLLEVKCCRCLHRREIPRLRVPALRAKAKERDTPLGMTPEREGDPALYR
jgi:hypothetical protein